MNKADLMAVCERIKIQQQAMYTAASLLREAWNDLNGLLPEQRDKETSPLDEQYPFDMGFDELVKELDIWKTYTEKNLSNLLNQKKFEESLLLMAGTANLDDWYSVILREMCDDCRKNEYVLFKFAKKLREQFRNINWDDDKYYHCFITVNETNIVVNEEHFVQNIGPGEDEKFTKLDIYDTTENYYHFIIQPCGDAKFVKMIVKED